MKRFVMVSILGLAMLLFGTQPNAATIDLISQTYTIKGDNNYPPDLIFFDITSSVPPLIGPFNSPSFGDLHANGGASGSSAFVDISASTRCSYDYASAEVVFQPTSPSYLDVSYSLGGPGISANYFSLSDLTTGIALVTAQQASYTPPLSGSVSVLVVPSDIYILSANCWANDDPARVKATLNDVPEPTTMLLLGSGLIGLVGLRRMRS